MLEMIKLRIIAVEQEASVKPIYVRLVEKDVDDAVVRLVETYGHGEHHELPSELVEASEEAERDAEGADPGAGAESPETT